MSLEIESVPLSEKHLEMQVIYVPQHAKGDPGHRDCEAGFISSFNDKFVFVKYGWGETSKATRPEDLVWALHIPES